MANTQKQIISGKPHGTYRILHTADWHLGKLLNDQSRDEEHTRFLDWLLEVVKQHEVHAGRILPLAQQGLGIDLDDCVKVNYLKFEGAVQPIPGLAAKED